MTALLIIAVRIARGPLDVRLKKRCAGPITAAAFAVVVYLAWDWLSPDGIGTPYFVGEFSGVLAMYLMTWALLLATRVRWLEQWFGGLDRMYFWHKQYALCAMLLFAPHILLTELGTAPRAVHEDPHLVGLGHLLGAVSGIGLLALVGISLARVGRILHLPYERWLLLHRLTGLLVLSALVHGWFLDPVTSGSAVLRILYVAVGAIGTAAYCYDELVMRRRAPRADYIVRTVERPAPDVLDVTLSPAGTTSLPVKGGQFIYLRVGNRPWREHPFSIAGTQPDGSVRLTVRALGRGTQRLYTDLREGLPATLDGPYGMFDHTVGGTRQIWIAGGIGIAPFLGWINSPSPAALPHADLFYCTPTPSEAPFLPDLAALAHRNSALRVHPVYSRSQGRIDVEKIQAAAGPLTPETHVFLCGPMGMISKLTHDLRRHGVPRSHVHAEHFAFR
ncbi:ferredoxin reductase family protein [Streptomyces sp. NPDC091215]|uniref:ferredoxin reductase family protein n=1 Tax=Streptomyces sp. NPDC091215 TaxID=3155192 RepID=UPI00342268D0